MRFFQAAGLSGFLALSGCFGSFDYQPQINEDPLPVDIGDLDAYLQKKESKMALLAPGVEKRVVWGVYGPRQSAYAVVYLHGYASSALEIDPIPYLTAQNLGANLYYTRFAGHGFADSSGEAFKGVSVADWRQDAYEALQIGEIIGKKVIVMGHSTGAALGVWLAGAYPKRVAAQIYIAPNLQPKALGAGLLAYRWGRALADKLLGGFYTFKGGQESSASSLDKFEPFFNRRQHLDAAQAMMLAVKAAQHLPIKQMNVPLFILASPKDQVVSSVYTQKFFNRYGQQSGAVKQLILTQASKTPNQHTIVGNATDPDMVPYTAEAIRLFLKKCGL